MAGVVIDAWSVVAYTERPITATEADELRNRIERELFAATVRMSATLDPHLRLRVEQ
jgi:hypothetical protein